MRLSRRWGQVRMPVGTENKNNKRCVLPANGIAREGGGRFRKRDASGGTTEKLPGNGKTKYGNHALCAYT